MAKHSPRKLPHPDDILADRVRPDPRELIAVIHDVNPTGLNLDRKETARRYALKSRLQSVLIRRFPDDIDAFPEPDEPGVIALRYQPLDLNACHAMLAELDDDARSRVQHIMDTRDDDATRPREPIGKKSIQQPRRRIAAPEDGEPLQTLLDQGAAALEAYDYELAKERFASALEQSNGGRDAARALLSLLVEQMGADEDALAFQDRLDDTAFSDTVVRSHLAIAAARLGNRPHALNLIEERGIKLQPSLIADVFIIFAKNELARGNLTQAKSDMNRAMELVRTHQEFAGLVDALAKARNAARGPEESEIANLLADGHLHEAEVRADELLARFPESDVARKVKRAIDEQKKRHTARTQFDEACIALESGQVIRAQSLFRAALALGLGVDESAMAEKHLAEIENAERTRIEEGRIAETLRVLETQDLAQGLSLYAALSDTSRRRVAEQFVSPAIAWLEELHVVRGGGKVGATITAILVLREAMDLVHSDPAGALERLAGQDKVLRGFKPAEQIRKTAQTLLAEQQRSYAQRRMEAVRKALFDGDPYLADRISNDVLEKHLSEDGVRVFGELRAQIQNVIERNALEATLEQLRRQGDTVGALNAAKRIAARAEGVAAERIAGTCADLRAETRRAFSVRVETAGATRSSEWNHFQDARILPKWKWETIFRDPDGGSDDFLLVLPQSMGDLVFIRIIDIKSGELRTRTTLRTPVHLEIIHSAISGRHLLLVGRFGAFLEIDLDDWSVQQWSPNCLRLSSESLRPKVDQIIVEMTLPEVILEGVTISPDGKYLWANVVHTKRSSEESGRMVYIIEIDGLKPFREFRIPSADHVYCHRVIGLDRPCVAVVHDDDAQSHQRTAFYDSRGRIWEGSPLDIPIEPKALVACPDQKRIFGLTSDPEIPRGNPETVPWGIYVIDGQRYSPFTVLPDITAVFHNTGMLSLEAGMCFFLFWMRRKCELIAIRQGMEGIEIAYRVDVPRYSALAGTADGRCATLLVVLDTRLEVIRLGATPPSFGPVEGQPPFHLPCLPQGSLAAKHFDCHVPTGAQKTAVDAIEMELVRQGKSRYKELLRKALKRADVDELLAFEFALRRVHESTQAGTLNAHLDARFPYHPRVKLTYARTMANIGRWQDILTKMKDIDPKTLCMAEAKHLHHMRGISLMMLGQLDAAIAEFDLGMKYEEGPCLIEELVALCVPVGADERAWGADTLVLRSWMRCIAAADEAFERGDVRDAHRALDVPIVWEAYELQSFARLTRAYLDEEESSSTSDPFRKAFALRGFCALFDVRKTMYRREVTLPRATWSDETLKELYQRALQWVERMLGKSDG